MRHSVRIGIGLACAAALVSGAAQAADELIPGKIHIVKPGVLAKMVAKPTTLFNLPAGDPTVDGGTLEIVDTIGGGSPPMVASLPAGGWKGLGNPAGSKGYKYKGAGSPSDPCKVVLVKEKVIKFVCKGAGVTLQPPFNGNSGILLTVSPGTPTRYCAEFGGQTIKNQGNLLKRKDAPVPGGCPVEGTTTTSTSSTSTTSTSSTSTSSTSTSSTSSTSTSVTSTTSSTVPCCNNAQAVSFLTADLPGDCGDITHFSGTPNTNLACAGLYTGGGGNSVPLPLTVPDLGFAINAITSCTGNVAQLGATTSTDTGSNLTCTAPGCRFGAPLAVPNPGTPPTSVCVINSVGGTTTGTLDCNTGDTDITLPLSSVLYLTGDTATDPGGSMPGVQPCPLCTGGDPDIPLSGTCIGGTNNGMACTPGTTTLGGDTAYPTSHDCPPDSTFDIGTLPIAFGLSSGTVSWTAVPSAGQPRVFSGFCRDADDTGAFENPAKKCLENGMTVSTCTGTFEACQQRSQGAFGPNGGGIRTITAIGTPAAGLLSGPASGTLVSVFSIPPTFNATVDAAGDLPGPGAVALPGTATLCPTASTCP